MMVAGAVRKRKKKNPVVRWLPAAFGLLVLLGGIGYSSVQVSSREARVSELTSEARQLKNELDKQKSAASAMKVKVKKNTTGLDSSIVDADKKTAEEFFKPAFSWGDGEAYDSARQMYIQALGEENSFLTTFLPENVKVDQYNYVDQMKANCSFVGMDIYPIAIDGDGYTYMGFVDFSSSGSGEFGAEGQGTAAVMFTVDRSAGDEGPVDVKDVEAWTVTPA